MTPVKGYSKMKDSGITEIGNIPKHWKITNIGRLFNVKAGGDAKPELYSDCQNLKHPYPVYTNSSDKNQIYAYTSKPMFNANSITVTGRGDVGKAFFRSTPFDAIIRLLVLSPKYTVNAKYYSYWISYVTQFLTTTTAVGQLSAQQIIPYKVALPPIEEQSAIAAYLDEKCPKIDEIIASAKVSIEDYKQWKASIVNDAITHGLNENEEKKESGIYWIGKMPKKWKLKRLKYLFSIKKNIAGEPGHTVLAITQQGIKPKNMSEKGQFALDYSKYQLVNPGDFAMNHMDLLTGWVDISQYNGVTSPDYRVFCAVNPEGICADYYKHIFQNCYRSRIFYGLGQGVAGFGRWRLPADMFLNFILPVPSIEEQKQIAAYLETKCSQIDELIKEKEGLILDLESYKKSLIYEVVTGKRKVI